MISFKGDYQTIMSLHTMEPLSLRSGAQDICAPRSSRLLRSHIFSPVCLPHSTSTAPSGKRFVCCTHTCQEELKDKRCADYSAACMFLRQMCPTSELGVAVSMRCAPSCTMHTQLLPWLFFRYQVRQKHKHDAFLLHAMHLEPSPGQQVPCRMTFVAWLRLEATEPATMASVVLLIAWSTSQHGL
jgi:hypothetical protein